MEEKKLREVQIGTEDIFDGVILNVKRDQVRLPNGHQSVREVIRHVGAVCVVPVTEDGKIVIERQYRYPINQVITEIPAGKLDSREEDRLHGAQRELAEETGITADRWTDMGLYYGAPAYSDEKITMYLAQELHLGRQHLDEDEFLNMEFVPIEEIVEEILTGKITDGKTQAAVLKAFMLLKKQKEQAD
ncbi:MAG: NUDIX hydrolase [Oscillospiraceae bacterium]|nr:NUDIX hydrolase [Oscillospiraceae bacterium]